MKLAELQKKIADVLGVSASQKELSYEIFIDKISEILLEQITLKVPRIGFFQLKADAADDGNQPLVFAPLSEDFAKDTRNFYLTLKVSPKIKTSLESDSSIFSIGVGKPLLPLSSEELPDTETSYALLKKSIEERVKELIMESDQIPNFNIWDDYYKSPEKYENGSRDESKNQLSDLTSDLSFTQEIIPDRIPDSILETVDDIAYAEDTSEKDDISNTDISIKGQSGDLESYEEYTIQDGENISGNEAEIVESGGEEPNSEPAGDQNTEDENDYSELENLEYDNSHDGSITISELLDDTLLPLIAQKKEVPAVKDDDLLPTSEVVKKIINDEVNEAPAGLKEESSDTEGEKPGSLFEEFHKMHDESAKTSDEENIYDGNKTEKAEVEQETKSQEDDIHRFEFEDNNQLIDSDASLQELLEEDEPDKIEWNWGDELREEFGIPVVAGKNTDTEPVNKSEPEEKNEVEFVDEYFLDEQIKKDLFSQLEKTLEREFRYEEPKKDSTYQDRGKSTLTLEKDNLKKVVLEFSGPPSKYEFIEEKPAEKEKRMAITLMDETPVRPGRSDSDSDDEIVVLDHNTLADALRNKTGAKASRSSEKIIGTEKFTIEDGDGGKSGYSKKMLLIFTGTVIIIAVIVALIFFLENRSAQNNEALNTANNSETGGKSEPVQNDFAVPDQPADNSTLPGLDEFNEFPRTAESPVPIKDATDRQILETIKKEAARLETSKKTDGIQPQNQIRQQTTPVSGSVSSETKISDRIFYDGKSYSLQISSWPTRSRADVEMNRLRGLGFNAVIVEANLPQKGGTWYRVRVGPFKSEQEANDFLRKNNF